VLSGVFLAPSLACAFVVVDRHAPRGTVTEAFSWLVTTFGVGAALGSAVAGPAVELAGTAAGFAVAAAGGLVALLVLLVTGRALRAPLDPGAGAAPAGPAGPADAARHAAPGDAPAAVRTEKNAR
jgi:predicted MFS family arabinose efflux permease